ncbi:sigma-70 family RNA polymerase sigma factor [Lacticaseibacillus baoqingensis]|uniref:Sigma-70 family RNA polymerase sigma factor n=1 Tax=Lacticaseibacillus baoqingensis TaxID=2486013 RepID=A0ABW4E8H9_9LACO|nr:sigma-70 family RNA polymerase sigma factor [Lacticaseibacillus baoqingensis]
MEKEATIQLVQRAQADSDAFAQLFAQYLPLVKKLLYTYHLPNYDRDDWYQEARIALLNAARRYNGSSGSRFGAYFRLVLNAHLASVMRYALAKKRRGDIETLVIAEPVDRPKELQLGQEVENGLLIAIQVEELFQSLSSLEAQAVLNAIAPLARSAGQLARAQERAKRKVVQFALDFHR